MTRNSQFTLKNLDKYLGKCVVFLWEPSSVRPYLYEKAFHSKLAKIFTWQDDLIDNKKVFRFVYPSYRSEMTNDIVPFNEKRLCTLINADKSSSHPYELYSERRNTIRFFEELNCKDFDFYGRGWKGRYKNYRGSIPSGRKLDYLKRYRFCIAYENMKDIKGYVTEKIFDCFEVGCIPVYWGASNITDYIPKKCFIDRRDFKNIEDLYRYLKNMKEEKYNQYLQNIKTYMQSESPRLFTYESVLEAITEALTKD